jgi:hypothetical protein
MNIPGLKRRTALISESAQNAFLGGCNALGQFGINASHAAFAVDCDASATLRRSSGAISTAHGAACQSRIRTASAGDWNDLCSVAALAGILRVASCQVTNGSI